MNIGAAWVKQMKAGGEYLSCQISIPFLGKINFSLFPVKEKKSANGPDYDVVWSDQKQGGADGAS